MTINKVDKVKIDDIDYSRNIYTHTGGKSVALIYPTNEKLKVFTPRLYVPFGISTYTPENTSEVKYSIDMSIKGDAMPIKNFIEFFEKLDDKIKKDAFEYSTEWFGKQLTEEEINKLYVPVLKKDDTGKYPPKITCKLTQTKSDFDCTFYDKSKKMIDISNIKKGTQVQVVIECIGMYFIKKQFGLTWKCLQMQLCSRDTLKGYAFKDDITDESADPNE